jgi:hypothetical protein
MPEIKALVLANIVSSNNIHSKLMSSQSETQPLEGRTRITGVPNWRTLSELVIGLSGFLGLLGLSGLLSLLGSLGCLGYRVA